MRKKLLPGILIAVLVLASSGPSAPNSEAADLGQRGGPPSQAQLDDWHGRMLGLFENPNVVFTDVDERTGRLTVGVEHGGAASNVRERLAQLGVPASAVDTVVTPPVVELTTLQQTVRPAGGGLQIIFVKFPFAYSCTLGFIAELGGVRGLVTNSHCTAKRGEVEGTKHYQAAYPADWVGTEIADPAFFQGSGCANKKKCSYADVAFSQLEIPNTDAPLGVIQRTTGPNNNVLTIDGSFSIVGEASGNAFTSETLNKVGRTTGWTQGPVERSCTNTTVSGSNILMLCQDWVTAKVGPGDSGSPVFKIDSGNTVTLYGIVWGSTNSGNTFIYSPMKNVRRTDSPGPALGPLTTY